MQIRKLELSDYYKQYFALLNQLSPTPEVSFEDFEKQYYIISPHHHIFVIEDVTNSIIIGTCTCFIEPKFIRGLSKVAHLEDVIIHKDCRGQGLGKKIIDFMTNFAKSQGCYKIILDCSDDNVAFYQKCNLERKGNQMVLYF